jgi:hypothetical protein
MGGAGGRDGLGGQGPRVVGAHGVERIGAENLVDQGLVPGPRGMAGGILAERDGPGDPHLRRLGGELAFVGEQGARRGQVEVTVEPVVQPRMRADRLPQHGHPVLRAVHEHLAAGGQAQLDERPGRGDQLGVAVVEQQVMAVPTVGDGAGTGHRGPLKTNPWARSIPSRRRSW